MYFFQLRILNWPNSRCLLVSAWLHALEDRSNIKQTTFFYNFFLLDSISHYVNVLHVSQRKRQVFTLMTTYCIGKLERFKEWDESLQI